MIDAACFAGFGEMAYCGMTTVFGGPLVAGIATFIILAFAMYKANMNMVTAIPLGIILLFSMYWIIMEDIFATLILLVLLGVGAILGIALIRHFYR